MMSCVHRSVCFCNRSIVGGGILADPSEKMSGILPGHFCDTI